MTSKHKDKDRDRERGKSRDKNRDRDREKEHKRRSSDRNVESKNNREKESSRDKERDRSRERYRSRDKDQAKEQSRNKERIRSPEKERERSRERYYSKEGSTRDRDRDVERSKDRNGSRERDRSDRDRDRDRFRDRDFDRDKDRDRRRRRRSKSHGRRRSRDRKSRDKDRDRNHDHDRHDRDSRYHDKFKQDSRAERESTSDINSLDFTQSVIENMMTTAANATKNFADLINNFNQSHAEHNDNSCASDFIFDKTADGDRKKKKKSRWAGGDHDKTFIPGMPTVLPATMTPDQQEAYLVQLQIEEISRKLRTGDLLIPQTPEERSPSPEPIYSSDGKRLNTREFRTRKRLEEQRHQLILRMQCMNPEFKPPSDYKPPVIRVSDKVLIPQEEHPDINFVGLLIGPRGNTLKAMEKETGAKIIIRGKGSVKEGKVGRKDGQPLPGEDEPLHAFITASNPEHVKKAVDKIKDVIRQGIEVPEGHNDLRRMQLRELAQLNGTLRETDSARCTNCGSSEHKSWLCPDKPNVTNNIVCSSCGGAGHIAKDCRSKRPGAGGPAAANNQAKIDEEYMSLMAELGEGPAPESPTPAPQTHRSFGIFDQRPAAPRPLMPPPAAPQQQYVSMSLPPIAPPGPPPAPMPQPMQQPMVPWNQPPPPGSCMSVNDMIPPPPGTCAPLPPSYMPFPPGTTAPPPPMAQWATSTPGILPPPTWPPGNLPPAGFIPPPPGPPMPPGTGNPLAGMPHILSAPPPPPPPSDLGF